VATLRYIPLLLALATPASLIAQGNVAAQMNDQEIVEFARKLLERPRARSAELVSGLNTIQSYVFKDKNAPEREYLLFAQGLLEDRTEQFTRAVVTFRRFERTWPNSQYMPEANLVIGRDALEKKAYSEAESRFRKVLGSDLPVESKLNAQGLLAWCLLEQKRMEDAIPVVQTIFPIGRSRPDERALVAIMEVQCATKALESARQTRTSYMGAFRNGSMKYRVNLAWGLLLGQSGQSVEAARALRDVIADMPNSEQADEARLALATLIADGKLPDKSNPDQESAESLITQLRTAGVGGDAPQRAHLLQIRIAHDEKQWNKVLSLTDQYRQLYPNSPNSDTAHSYRVETLRTLVQNSINSSEPWSVLPLLSNENIGLLTPQLRSALVSIFATRGLPEAATTIIQASPETEKADLRQTLSQSISETLPPPQVLANLNENLTKDKSELGQVQILLSEKNWIDAGMKITKLTPGEDRINAVLTLLRRPMLPYEIPARLNEAEDWLKKCSEKSPVNEPLIIFVADLRMQTNNPKGALALYPEKPQPENRGWVSLMRATAMVKLGQNEGAKKLLEENSSVPEFKSNRQALADRLNR